MVCELPSVKVRSIRKDCFKPVVPNSRACAVISSLVRAKGKLVFMASPQIRCDERSNEPAIPERVPVMFEMRSGSPSLTVSSNNKSRVFCFM